MNCRDCGKEIPLKEFSYHRCKSDDPGKTVFKFTHLIPDEEIDRVRPKRTCPECNGSGGREPVILRRGRWIKCPACKGCGLIEEKKESK
jgi:hypothetical protein